MTIFDDLGLGGTLNDLTAPLRGVGSIGTGLGQGFSGLGTGIGQGAAGFGLAAGNLVNKAGGALDVLSNPLILIGGGILAIVVLTKIK